MTQGIDDLDGISWELVLALLGAWVLIYLPVIKGIKSAGKVYISLHLNQFVGMVKGDKN